MRTFLLLLAAVVVFAFIARGRTKPSQTTPEPGAEREPDVAISEAEEGNEDASEMDEDGEPTFTPVSTADGWVLAPEGDGVVAVRTLIMAPGQFVAARVLPVPDARRWALEVLGKEAIDADEGTCWPFGGWEFKNEAEARAALDLIQRRIVRPPRDENGETRTLSDEDFERSRRFAEQPLPDSEPASPL